jgi:hypothetical protein
MSITTTSITDVQVESDDNRSSIGHEGQFASLVLASRTALHASYKLEVKGQQTGEHYREVSLPLKIKGVNCSMFCYFGLASQTWSTRNPKLKIPH